MFSERPKLIDGITFQTSTTWTFWNVYKSAEQLKIEIRNNKNGMQYSGQFQNV